VISWNIRQGGGKRIEHIIGALLAAAPDVVVVTEVRHGTNARLLRWKLEHSGLGFHLLSGDRHALVVASRVPFAHEPVPDWPADWDSRLVSVWIDGVHLLAGQFPAEAPHIERAFESLIAATARWRLQGVPRLLIGNLNTGASLEDTSDGPFAAGSHFEELLAAGWDDVWRTQNPGLSEYSYVGGHGRGSRIDHALVLNWPPDLFPTARYDHLVRERRLSHHSMLIVDWATGGMTASTASLPGLR
jgi:exonuclease III